MVIVLVCKDNTIPSHAFDQHLNKSHVERRSCWNYGSGVYRDGERVRSFNQNSFQSFSTFADVVKGEKQRNHEEGMENEEKCMAMRCSDDGQLKQVVKRVRKGTDVQQYKKIEKRKEDNCGLVGEGSLLQENIKRVEKGCRVQNLSDIGREDSWVRKSRVNETEKGMCSARGNYCDGDTFSPFSDSKDKRGLQFQKVGNLTKDGSGGLQKEDGFDEPSHGSVVEADLSRLTGLKGLIENQELQMLEGPIGGVKVRLMGSLGTDHFDVSLDQGLDYEDGEIKSPKDMSCGGNVELCGNGSDGMELSILAPVSVEVLKSGDEGCVKSPITLGNGVAESDLTLQRDFR
ncbi:hypothetical protein Q3G72_000376 [Acer saccharum]|nr:hypothetical protein Q3G72_000376 [Acer saccharum]